MSLEINTVLEWLDAGENTSQPQLERVLAISVTNSAVLVVELVSRAVLPFVRRLDEITGALAENRARVLERDPYMPLNRLEGQLSPRERELRDSAWKVIEPLVGDCVELLLAERPIGTIVTKAATDAGLSRPTVYKYLRKYWQGGQRANALLPHFFRQGAKGRPRVFKGGKLGAPSKLSKASDGAEGVGINVAGNQRIVGLLQRGYREFYVKGGMSIGVAYQRTLERYFNIGYEKHGNALVPMLPGDRQRPSLRQFSYHNRHERGSEAEVRARVGERTYNLEHRPVLGGSGHLAFGPGSMFQVDATVGDIYLVSSLNPNHIIGRPVIYVLIDVFSRMIVGYAVTLEGPSWLGATLALENAFSGKVAHCAEFGIEISENEWPCHHLPRVILADGGEFAGYSADNLVKNLSIRVDNAPPYRADWKGIVERNFRLVKEKGVRFRPGEVRKLAPRSGEDYRLDAKLTLNDLREIMIRVILSHNLAHNMDWYSRDEFMITDEVERYPIHLWNWGITNRSGLLQTQDPDVVRKSLLPTSPATVTARGIRLKGVYYTCATAERESWFVRVGRKGHSETRSVTMSYDRRSSSIAYLHLDDGTLEPCRVLRRETALDFRDWYEIEEQQALDTIGSHRAETGKLQDKAALEAHIKEIEARAERRLDQPHTPASNGKRLKGIRTNRKAEREVEQAAYLSKLDPPPSSAHVATQGLSDISAGSVIPLETPLDFGNTKRSYDDLIADMHDSKDDDE